MKVKYTLLLAFCLSSSFVLTACNAPLSVLASRQDQEHLPVRANVVTGSAGNTLQLTALEKLPASLRSGENIQALMDNSTNIYPVTRNADGSLSVPLPAGRLPDSQGELVIFLIDAQKQSYPIRVQTGPLLAMATPAFAVSPNSTVLQGTRIQVAARFKAAVAPDAYRFSWFVGQSGQGPWTALSGTQETISWEAERPGNYFLRLDTQEQSTGFTSRFVSPAPVITVLESKTIAETTPSNGILVQGQRIRLKAALPELNPASTYAWFYAQSPQAPFQPIEAQGAEVDWEPPLAGSYYLQLRVTDAQGKVSRYTSTQAQVFVNDAEQVIQTQPLSGTVLRGKSIQLKANLPELPPEFLADDLEYSWFFGTSPQGSFSAIPGKGPEVTWYPRSLGEFYLRLRVHSPKLNQTRTFTPAESLVSVQDSDAPFQIQPDPAILVKGQAVQLRFSEASQNKKVTWFYARNSQGPFTSIPGQGTEITWTPNQAGSFYLRTEVSGDNQPPATFTSATARVTVSESSDVIRLSRSRINLGGSIQLKAQVPNPHSKLKYHWYAGLSPNGPWQAIQSLDAQTQAAEINWTPGQTGNFYLKVDVVDARSVISYMTPQAAAFVTEDIAFFLTNPALARIGSQGAVTLSTTYNPPSSQLIYAWSFSPSPVGPWTAIGGSYQPQMEWIKPGIQGDFYIKFDVIATQTNQTLSFISSAPLVFVGESQRALPRF